MLIIFSMLRLAVRARLSVAVRAEDDVARAASLLPGEYMREWWRETSARCCPRSSRVRTPSSAPTSARWPRRPLSPAKSRGARTPGKCRVGRTQPRRRVTASGPRLRAFTSCTLLPAPSNAVCMSERKDEHHRVVAGIAQHWRAAHPVHVRAGEERKELLVADPGSSTPIAAATATWSP